MQAVPFIIERVFDTPAHVLWKAITDKNEMKEWFFDVKEFKAEPGYRFSFSGGKDGRVYQHLCEVVEVIPYKKLSYTWKYEGYEGISKVIFELSEEDGKTRLKLTHEGLETFPAATNPDLAKENFIGGWTAIIGTSLPEYIVKTGAATRL